MQGTLPALTQADSKWGGWQSVKRGVCLENFIVVVFVVVFWFVSYITKLEFCKVASV